MPKTLDLSHLSDAVRGTAAAFRRRQRLQPAGGPGDKVFPPTYVGAVYAVEQRRIDGEVKECVVLDSVQSQANRMEEGLQQAIDEDDIALPLVVVDFSGSGLPSIQRVTSLEAPHRIVDAIIRDSLYEGVKFRESDVGGSLNDASVKNGTPVFELSPPSLVFGMWDSHGPRGGLGAKFERAITSEIVGIDIAYGLRTGGRIDPLGIQLSAGEVYETADGGWTLDPEQAVEEKGKPKKVGGRGGGKPSEVGHGNVAPGFGEYSDNVGVRDPLGLADSVRSGGVAPGGVTMDYALQTTVLSLAGLRRLRFPIEDERDPAVETAARTLLAALGLCAATIAGSRGYDLRSRCVLVPEEAPRWELLDQPGSDASEFELDHEAAIDLLANAASAAEEAGLPWRTKPIVLEPSPELVELVRRSHGTATGEAADA